MNNELDFHDPDFHQFLIHQLTFGQIEYLWGLFQLYRAGELITVEIKAHQGAYQSIKPSNSTPISEQEIKDFENYLNSGSYEL